MPTSGSQYNLTLDEALQRYRVVQAHSVDYIADYSATIRQSFGERYGGAILANDMQAPPQSTSQEESEMSQIGSLVGHSPDITSLVTHPMVVGTGKVGIEVELESAAHRRMHYWNSIGDNSLRDNGVEYVMKQPLGGRDLQAAIFELDTAMHEVSPNPSWRCSSHVHLDVRDMTVPQLKKFILAYTALERIIFQCSGMQRWDNNFCPSFGFAQSQVQKLAAIWHRSGRNFLNDLDTTNRHGDRDKYSSLNFLPIRRQGSIEFRGSEAKFRKGQLLRLANRVLSIREFAISFEGTEIELVHYIAANNPKVILKKSMPSKFSFEQSDLHLGCDLALDIIHMGGLRNHQNASDILVRTRWADAWHEEFDEVKPDRIAASELYRKCTEAGRFCGDFIHANSFEAFSEWARANNLEL